MNVFVDTSAIYAVFDRDDINHPRARVAWEQLLRESGSLLTSNYVLVEAGALLQHRLGLQAVRALYDDVVPLLTVEWITETIHRSAVASLLTASRRNLSLVDCVSFHVMRAASVQSAFCFDRHFREQGFLTLP
jgi:predicted nucleic acid-binding protein